MRTILPSNERPTGIRTQYGSFRHRADVIKGKREIEEMKDFRIQNQSP
jgi:hypothetical protein